MNVLNKFANLIRYTGIKVSKATVTIDKQSSDCTEIRRADITLKRNSVSVPSIGVQSLNFGFEAI